MDNIKPNYDITENVCKIDYENLRKVMVFQLLNSFVVQFVFCF